MTKQSMKMAKCVGFIALHTDYPKLWQKHTRRCVNGLTKFQRIVRSGITTFTIELLDGSELYFKSLKKCVRKEDITEFIKRATGKSGYHLYRTGNPMRYIVIFKPPTRCIECGGKCKLYNNKCAFCSVDSDVVESIYRPRRLSRSYPHTRYDISKTQNKSKDYSSIRVYHDDDGQQGVIEFLNWEGFAIREVRNDRLMTMPNDNYDPTNVVLESKIPKIFLDRYIPVF